MGFSLAWAAIKAGRDSVIQELNLTGTSEKEEFAESEITGAEIPGGWFLVIAQYNNLEFNKEEIMSGLSRLGKCEAVAGIVEEHVMLSATSYWRDGECVWLVMHDSAEGLSHLETVGPLPPEFAGIRDRLFAQQEADGGAESDVDHIFEIPVKLGQILTGYRYDQDIPGLEEPGFEVLARAA